MELIVKPTELCNFKCTFCSSTELVENKAQMLNIEEIFNFLRRFPMTNTIIVNGGDPLMMPVEYYWQIIDFLDRQDMDTCISFTSNLWDFYKKPKKWRELFLHERMRVTTSFNYGDTRRITNDKVFTEEVFWQVSDLFLKEIGYRPDFISVINDDNEDTALDNVYLAKKMNVECKLNYAMASGREVMPYQLSKIYKIYLEVYDKGLLQWEYNTKQMVRRLNGGATTCPQNRDCDAGIRCLQPDGAYYSCGAFGDDNLYPIPFQKEMESSVIERPLLKEEEINFLKEECLTCPMFKICNGCKKTIFDMKKAKTIESHCQLMKRISTKILEVSV